MPVFSLVCLLKMRSYFDCIFKKMIPYEELVTLQCRYHVLFCSATCRGPVCVQDDCSTTVTRQSCRGVHCASCTHVHSSPGGCPSPPVLIMCYVPRLYAIHMITALALASLMDGVIIPITKTQMSSNHQIRIFMKNYICIFLCIFV